MPQNFSNRKQRAMDSLSQGTYGTTGEKLQWSLYDDTTLATGDTVKRLFTVPVGQNGKTLSNTNMTQSGQIAQGQNMQVRALRMIYTPAAAWDLTKLTAFFNFLKTTVVEIVINNKAPMIQGTLAEFMGASINGAAAAAVAGSSLISGQVGFLTGVFPMNIPLNLAALTPFEVRLTYTTAIPAALNGDNFTFSLQGRLVRAI